MSLKTEMKEFMRTMIKVHEGHRHCNICGDVLVLEDGCHACKICIKTGVDQI